MCSVGYREQRPERRPVRRDTQRHPSVGGWVTSTADGEIVERSYVAGWIKRGPRGFIGSNKACAKETVSHLLADFRQGRLPG